MAADASPPELPQKPKAHAEEINGHWFWCRPIDQNASPDPTSGRDWVDSNGNRFWCVPYEKEFGRRYDAKGKIDPKIID